jgi:hypothetical protein
VQAKAKSPEMTIVDGIEEIAKAALVSTGSK